MELLKERRVIYVFGNHDIPEWFDENLKQIFGDPTLMFRLQWYGRSYLFVHGDTLTTVPIIQHPLWVAMIRTFKVDTLIYFFYRMMIKRSFQRYKELGRPLNMQQKILGRIFRSEHILVCGHTHSLEYDMVERYVNLGVIFGGWGSYMFFKDGVETPFVVEQRYE